MPKTAPRGASRLRRATLADLDAIAALEEVCFQDYRRASRGSLRRSLASPKQSVWVVDAYGGSGLAALLVLWHFPHRVRIYDIATHPDARGQGLGAVLMAHAESEARGAGCQWLSLEAEQADPRLVGWYEGQGFTTVARLRDFYHDGCHALRMVRPLR
ncbi:MAG: N-acetyltransferase [bacterium]